MKDEITPVDQECIDVMATIEHWLQHWSDVLAERDGPRHVPEFITSMHVLCHQLLDILGATEEEAEEDRLTLGTRH